MSTLDAIPLQDQHVHLHSEAVGADELPHYSPPPSVNPSAAAAHAGARRQPLRLLHKRFPIHKMTYKVHPTAARVGWRRLLRTRAWYSVLWKREGEVWNDSWPSAWGAVDADEETIGRDSGVSMRSAPVDAGGNRELAHLYHERCGVLAELIQSQLSSTRIIIVLLEMIDVLLVVLFIIALAVDMGQQNLFLEVIELFLVLVILLHAGGISLVRTKRFTLSRQLRNLSREWSPLPLTSSTNRALVNNAEDGERDEEEAVEQVKNSLRWNLRTVEGSFWLSYQPVILVELIVPPPSYPTSGQGAHPTTPAPSYPARARPGAYTPHSQRHPLPQPMNLPAYSPNTRPLSAISHRMTSMSSDEHSNTSTLSPSTNGHARSGSTASSRRRVPVPSIEGSSPVIIPSARTAAHDHHGADAALHALD